MTTPRSSGDNLESPAPGAPTEMEMRRWAAAPATVEYYSRCIVTAQILDFLGHEAKSDREEHFAS